MIHNVLDFITKHSFFVVIVVIAVTVGIFPGILLIEVDNSTEGYFSADDPLLLIDVNADELFNISDSVILFSYPAENIYDAQVIKNIERIHRDLETYPFVEEVTSVINVRDIKGEDNTIYLEDLLERDFNDNPILPTTQAELQDLRQKIESNHYYEGTLVAKKKNEAGLPVAWSISVDLKAQSESGLAIQLDDVVPKLIDVRDKYREEGIELTLFGLDYLIYHMNKESREDVALQTVLITIIIAITFFFNFRTVVGTFIPLISVLIGMIWIFGLMGYLGIKLSVIGLLIIPLSLAIGSSYSIHSLNQYYKEIFSYRNEERQSSIRDIMHHILFTIFLAGLTTFIGIISLSLSDLTHLKYFGIFSALGVLFNVILALTFIPAVLVHVKVPDKKVATQFNESKMDKMIDTVSSFITRRYWLVFTVGMIIILVSIYGITHLSSYFAKVENFHPSHPIRDESKYISENYGGITFLNVVFDMFPADPLIKITNLDDRIKPSASASIEEDNEEPIEGFDDQPSDPFGEAAPSNQEDPFGESSSMSTSDLFGEAQTNNTQDPFGESGSMSNSDPFGENSSSSAADPFGESVDSTSSQASINGDVETDSQPNNLVMTEADYYKALKSQLLKDIDALAAHLKTIECVGDVYSLNDVMKRFHYVSHSSQEEYEVVPESDERIMNYIQIFSGKDSDYNGVADDLENFIDPSYNKINMIVTVGDWPDRFVNTGDYQMLEEEIASFIDNRFKSNVDKYYITGTATLEKTVQDKIVYIQIQSIIFSVILIFFICSWVFRSFKMGAIAIIPTSVAVIVNFAIMGYANIELNFGTAIIFCLAIGIGIDDTMHFLLRFRSTSKENMGEDLKDIVKKSIMYAGKAIIYTSVALIFSFTVLYTSSFMPIIYLGILVALTMINATIATLLFLPSIVLCFPFLTRKYRQAMGKEVIEATTG